ncbi:MAG: hypothetical protein ABIE74_09990 [Pseudomonadota bacterium]
MKRILKADVKERPKLQEKLMESLSKKSTFIQKQMPTILRRAITAPKVVYRRFRLVGRRRMVTDRRAELRHKGHHRAHEGARQHAHDSHRIDRGRLSKRHADYLRSFFGDRSKIGSSEQKAAKAGMDEMLSKFEKLILACFEQGKTIGKKSADGLPHFNAKDLAQWREFFSNFSAEKRKILLEQVRNFLFRGVVEREGGKNPLLISDMMLQSGRMEKYIRLPVMMELLGKLKAMHPGEKFGKELLKLAEGDELIYLALMTEEGMDFLHGLKPKQGMFMSEKGESIVKQHLGLGSPMSDQLGRKTQTLHKNKTRGFLGFLGFFKGEKGVESEETPYRFTGWRQNLERPQMLPFRIVRVVIYLALLVFSILGIGALLYKFLSQ